jgi:hypothetical protein
MNCDRECLRADRTDPCDFASLSRFATSHCCEAAEVPEQRLGGDCGDAWHGAKGPLGSRTSHLALGALRIRRLIPVPNPGTALSQAVKPQSRVTRIHRANNANAQIHDRHANPTNGGLAQWTAVKRSALDEEIREPRNSANTSELGPERTSGDGCMQPADGLTLDDRLVPDLIVTCPEASPLDRNAERREVLHCHVRLSRIGYDSHDHEENLAKRRRPGRDGGVPLQQQLLGLSRSESP